MKRRLTIAGLLVLALLLTACGKKKNEYSADVTNPFTDYDTLAEAETAAGVTLAEMPFVEGYDQYVYRASENEMLEVIYQDAKGNEGLRVRKAKGSNDISGDYNEYEEQTQIVLDQFTADMKGNDGKAGVITWVELIDGTSYTYAINIGEANIDQVGATTLVSSISDLTHIAPETTPAAEAAAESGTITGDEIEAGSPLAGHTFKVVSKTMRVKADTLNARIYPGDIVEGAEAVTQLDNGATIDVVYESDEWSAFWYNNRLLWVKSEYLE